MLRPGDRPLPSRTSRGFRTPGHLVDRSSAMDGGAAVVIGDVIAREGAVAAWSIPGSVVRGAGRCRRTPLPPAPWTAVTGRPRRVCRPVRRCPASEVLPLSMPGVLRKRCGRPMLPEVRSRVPPSTCRPPTITPESNTCAKIGGVVSYERAPKFCPNVMYPYVVDVSACPRRGDRDMF